MNKKGLMPSRLSGLQEQRCEYSEALPNITAQRPSRVLLRVGAEGPQLSENHTTPEIRSSDSNRSDRSTGSSAASTSG